MMDSTVTEDQTNSSETNTPKSTSQSKEATGSTNSHHEAASSAESHTDDQSTSKTAECTQRPTTPTPSGPFAPDESNVGSSQRSPSLQLQQLNMTNTNSNTTHNIVSPSNTHEPLNRHKYRICAGPNDVGEPGPKGKRSQDFYNSWPLYNAFHEIISGNRDTWPPENVLLQDWHIAKILAANISGKEYIRCWPGDFSSKNAHSIRNGRLPRGRAAKIKSPTDGKFYYAVVFGTYQLSGDEGGQVNGEIPIVVEGSDAHQSSTGERKKIGLGQLCEIQSDFTPDETELLNGVESLRFPNPRLPPLHQRQDWGLENKDSISANTSPNSNNGNSRSLSKHGQTTLPNNATSGGKSSATKSGKSKPNVSVVVGTFCFFLFLSLSVPMQQQKYSFVKRFLL
jgi:hypothetical protein